MTIYFKVNHQFIGIKHSPLYFYKFYIELYFEAVQFSNKNKTKFNIEIETTEFFINQFCINFYFIFKNPSPYSMYFKRLPDETIHEDLSMFNSV